jgi:hypothetical protein
LKRIGRGLEEDQKRSGSGFEEDWKQFESISWSTESKKSNHILQNKIK